MQSFSAIVIDDEKSSRSVIKQILQLYIPSVRYAGEASNVLEGIKLIKELKPDLVFLDIEMPEHNGFYLFEKLENIDFHVIFTTAYAQYALKAFEVAAVDYLLKPIQIEAVEKAVARIQRPVELDDFKQKLETLLVNNQFHEPRRIAINSVSGCVFLDLEDIQYIEADGSYSNIFTKSHGMITYSKRLKELEKILCGNVLMRCHRSFIININEVKALIKKEGGAVQMKDDKLIPISTDKKDELMQQFMKL